MNKDALEKLIESVVDWARAYQHALDQGPESEAVACEAELKSAKTELIAALAPETNQPEGIGEYAFAPQPVHLLVAHLNDTEELVCIYGGVITTISDMPTGHWRKVAP